MANITRPVTSFYHLCSAGNRTDLLFHNPQEFISGMNLVAIAAMKSDLSILAFCLMDNHMHFILSAGRDEDIIDFATRISQLYKRRFVNLCSLKEPIRWSYFRIDTESYLKYAIAYTLKNPSNAYYRRMPIYYPWSTANLYFCDDMEMRSRLSRFHTFKEVPKTEIRDLIKSRHDFPANWYLTDRNYIWPGNYVDWRKVESFYNDGREFLYFLSATKKEHIQEIASFSRRICIPDQEMKQHATKLCEEYFHHKSLTELKLSERQILQKQLTHQYGCAEKQIARILHLTVIHD